MSKQPSIFISHSSKDKEIVNDFIDLILQAGLSVPIDEIFCTTIDGTKIKSGDDWRNSIQSALKFAKINLLFISPNYKESEVCLNEMGAAWVTSKNVFPLMIEPINYSTVGIIQQPKQIERLLDETSLDRIRDSIQEELDIPAKLIKSDRWTTKKSEFIYKIANYLEDKSFEKPIDRKTFNEILEKNSNLESSIKNLIKEKGQLEKMISELKLAKDKSDIKKIERKYSDTTEFEEFQKLCKNVNNLLSNFQPIIRGIIFKRYSGKEITINWEPYRDDIDYANANDYIDSDMDADFESTREMQEVSKGIYELENLMKSELSEDFYELYEENFDSNLSLSNISFWEEVIDVKTLI
jgi:hypothetical protein